VATGPASRADRLRLAAEAQFEVVDPRSAAAVAAVAAYVAELDQRFPGGFDVGGDIGADAAAFDPPTGAFVMVRVGGVTVGCGALQRLADDTAEIKRMWIDPAWRGLGVAPRLLAHLEQLARERGHSMVRLDTSATLTEAIALYERSGYRSIERYNDNPYAQRWFEKVVA
jgi:GNAT superfamily N-acetyltransferase